MYLCLVHAVGMLGWSCQAPHAAYNGSVCCTVLAAAASADTSERQPLCRFQPVGASNDQNRRSLTCSASLFFHTSKRAARPLNPYPRLALLIRMYERLSLLASL